MEESLYRLTIQNIEETYNNIVHGHVMFSDNAEQHGNLERDNLVWATN